MSAVTVPDPTSPVGPATETKAAVRRELLREILRSKAFIIGAALVLFWVVCAIFRDFIIVYDPTDDNAYKQHLRPLTEDYYLGTDRLGRDVFSRVISGARVILEIAPAAVILGTVVGVLLGLIMGYYRGLVDDILGRVIDAVMAIPVILVALLTLVSLGPSTLTVITVIGLLFAPLIARTVRAAVLVERDLDYVRAARLRGERSPYVMLVEILPNVVGPIIVEFTVRLGYAIFTLAGLSFLGFGSQPPSPDWGLMIAEERNFISAGVWWPSIFPAIAIATLVIGVILVADAIQAAFDR